MIKNLKLYLVLVLLVSINSLCFAANVGNELDDSARNINKIKIRHTIKEISMMNEAMGRGKDLGYSSSGLARYFELGMARVTVKENTLYTQKIGIWTFVGDGNCSQAGKCYVKVKITNPDDEFTVPLIKNSKGYITVK